MSYSILLKINEVTHGQFETIRQQLNSGTQESQSRILGEVLSEIACEMLRSLVGSEMCIRDRFGNERLCPFVNYFSDMIKYHDEQVYVSYPIDRNLVQQAHALVNKLKNNEIQDMVDVFQTLIEIVDIGVTSLIREPKKCLNFNKVVDKTLNGVINMTAHLSYKRLEKMGNQVDSNAATDCVNHFLAFMHVDTE